MNESVPNVAAHYALSLKRNLRANYPAHSLRMRRALACGRARDPWSSKPIEIVA